MAAELGSEMVNHLGPKWRRHHTITLPEPAFIPNLKLLCMSTGALEAQRMQDKVRGNLKGSRQANCCGLNCIRLCQHLSERGLFV